MADALTDTREFLDELVIELTGLHVNATKLQTTPEDREPVQALIGVPARLITAAQALRARLADEPEPQVEAENKPKAKPRSKAAA